MTASLKSGDTELTTDILVNEISDFIVYDTAKFVEVLNKSGIEASEKMPDETLVDLFIKNLPVNKNLSKAMAFQIADSNGLINNGTDNKNKQIAIIDIIARGVSDTGNNIYENPDLSKSVKIDIMNHIVAKAKAKGNYQRVIFNPSSKVIYWIVGGIIIAVVGYMIYRSYQIKKLAEGGAVPIASTNTPIVDTIITPAPTPTPNVISATNNGGTAPIHQAPILKSVTPVQNVG
jgi:hypothetical protein